MGYAGSALDNAYGSKIITPQFLNVGSEEITLNDLRPVSSAASMDWMIELQRVDNGGETIESEDYMWVGGQWCDVFGTPITKTVTFAPGESVVAYSYLGDTAANLQSSGEVNEKKVVVALDTAWGSVISGNPYPVEIELNQLIPLDDKDVAIGDWMIEIQKVDNGGETIEAEDYMWVGNQWCDVYGSPIKEKITFDPGEGFVVYSYTGSAAYLHIVAPEL